MPKGGTPPLVPMWPQPHIRELNQNPFPFFPFDPQWGHELPMLELDSFCALLRMAWVSPRPCYLPADREELSRVLRQNRVPGGGATISDQVMAFFATDARTGLLYFPPQLRSLERMVNGENMYALLWDDSTSRGSAI